MFRVLAMTIVGGLVAAALPSCRPAPASDGDAADAALLETFERRMVESIARVRESAVALEYTAADTPSGERRVATGVVVNDQGDVLSIRIDPPSASSPIVARDASGVRRPARWVATTRRRA